MHERGMYKRLEHWKSCYRARDSVVSRLPTFRAVPEVRAAEDRRSVSRRLSLYLYLVVSSCHAPVHALTDVYREATHDPRLATRLVREGSAQLRLDRAQSPDRTDARNWWE